MKKAIVVVILLCVVAGGVAFALTRGTPERQLCTQVAKLCKVEGTVKDLDECASDLEKLKEHLGEKRLEETAECVDEAGSCPDAMGCMAGTGMKVLQEAAGEFLKGLGRSLNPKKDKK